MPITLGCPSCGKRFRARDESAGKKVKCPYCQAAVPVPAEEESATAGAPTAPPLPPATPTPPPARSGPPPRPASPPPAPAVASPDDWGAISTPTAPVTPEHPGAPAPEPKAEPERAAEPEPISDLVEMPRDRNRDRGDKPRPKATKPEPKKTAEKGKKPTETPGEVLAKKWASVWRGLFWVQFGLLFVALLGFVGFGEAIYARAVGELPTSKDPGVVKIDGYVNTADRDAIPLSKAEELDLLVYGVPIFMAGFLMTIGRLFSGGGPRSSGARGLFVFSGVVTLVAFIALLASEVCKKMLFRDEAAYAVLTLMVCAPLAEFWFLTGLTASGLALKRPGVARAVGVVVFLFAMIPVIATVGWDQYLLHAGRPKEKDPALVDWRMYEQAALLIGWLILVGAYWRAVRGVRVGAFEFIAAVEDAKANEEAERK